MKKINFLGIAFGLTVMLLFLIGFSDVGIAGVAIALIPLSGVNKVAFEKMDSKKIVKEFAKETSKNSLVEFIQEEERQANKDNNKYVDHYAGMSGHEMILHRLKNPDKLLAVENQSAIHGVKYGKDSFDKYSSLQNAAGDILMPAMLSALVEMAMFRDESELNDIVAASIGQDQTSVKKLVLTDDEKYRKLSRVAFNADFPRIKFEVGDKEENMSQIAGQFTLSQRELQAMTLNIADPVIQLITRQIATDRITGALNVLYSGDANGGNITGASLVMQTAASGSVSSTDVINFLLFGKPQWFKDGFVLVSNSAMLSKWFTGWASLDNYPGKIEAMKLQVPLAVKQWEEGVLEPTNGTAKDIIMKFNPKVAVYEYFQNGGVKIGVTEDSSQRNNYSISFANTMLKGHTDATVALDITH